VLNEPVEIWRALMKVILLEDIESLGSQGDVVEVKPGYARNYLIPKGKALEATSANLHRIEQIRRKAESVKLKTLNDAQRLAERLEGISITISRKAGENERLFGSVTSMDIQRALQQEGIDIDRKKIQLEEPIKSLGFYQVPVKLHPEVTAQVKLWVVQT
jgi:large subunit ribosomal protein L9